MAGEEGKIIRKKRKERINLMPESWQIQLAKLPTFFVFVVDEFIRQIHRGLSGRGMDGQQIKNA